MKNLIFVLLTGILLLSGCSKDYIETDHLIEDDVSITEGDDLSLRSGNPDDPYPLTQFPIIIVGKTNQKIEGRFVGDSYCYKGIESLGKIGFEIDLELNIGYSEKTSEGTEVLIDKITVKAAKALSGTPFIAHLHAYASSPSDYFESFKHTGKYLGDFDQTGPWVYNVDKKFMLKPGKGLIVALRLADSLDTSNESPTVFCPMVCTFGLETDETFVPMEKMRGALETVFQSPDDRISATWVYKDFLGLAYGNDYSIIDMRTGEKVAQGSYSDEAAGKFWHNAPPVKIGNIEHHPISECNGITAGWIYEDLLGFTSKNAYWHSLLNNFHKQEVWELDGSESGNLQEHEFWNKPEVESLFENGVTAGLKTPFGFHIVFSKDKIYVYSNRAEKWIISKPYKYLQPGEPFHFLAPIAKEGILPEINAAFYNSGSKEFVFMNGKTWHAYKIYGEKAGEWKHGNLGHSTSGVYKSANIEPLKNTVIYRELQIKNGNFVDSDLDGASNRREKGARTTTSNPNYSDFKNVGNRYDMVGPDHTQINGISASTKSIYNGYVNTCDLPLGLEAVNNSGDHVFIYPIKNMSFGEYQALLNSIPWQ